MNLLKTILIYLAILFSSSVQNSYGNAQPPMATPAFTATPAVTVTAAAPISDADPTPMGTAVPTLGSLLTPNPNYNTLRTGASGDEVIKLQKKLAEYGYFDGDIDGMYGKKTRQAVERFQRANGLGADGVAGKKTLTLLYEGENVVPYHTATPAPTVAPTPNASPASTATQASVSAKETPVPATSEPTATPKPTATPVLFMEMDRWNVYAGDAIEPVSDPQNKVLHPYQANGETYLPICRILKQFGYILIEDETNGKYGIAFADGNDVVNIGFQIKENGSFGPLEIKRNSVPMILQNRDVQMVGDEVYLPASTIQAMMNVRLDSDPMEKTIRVRLP